MNIPNSIASSPTKIKDQGTLFIFLVSGSKKNVGIIFVAKGVLSDKTLNNIKKLKTEEKVEINGVFYDKYISEKANKSISYITYKNGYNYLITSSGGTDYIEYFGFLP